MTPLRQRTIEDMRLRNLSPHTIDAYVLAVKQFAAHLGRSPEQLGGDDARRYLLHLVQEQKASWSRYNLARTAARRSTTRGSRAAGGCCTKRAIGTTTGNSAAAARWAPGCASAT